MFISSPDVTVLLGCLFTCLLDSLLTLFLSPIFPFVSVSASSGAGSPSCLSSDPTGSEAFYSFHSAPALSLLLFFGAEFTRARLSTEKMMPGSTVDRKGLRGPGSGLVIWAMCLKNMSAQSPLSAVSFSPRWLESKLVGGLRSPPCAPEGPGSPGPLAYLVQRGSAPPAGRVQGQFLQSLKLTGSSSCCSSHSRI